MPRIARKTLLHREYGRGHYFQLLTGHDFFNDGFGTDTEAMRTAWADRRVREVVYNLLKERGRRGHRRERPWAEIEFGVARAGRGAAAP